MKRKLLVCRGRFLLLASIIFSTRAASAANWIVNNDGYWSVGSNWDTGQMPINGASASIIYPTLLGGEVVTLSYSYQTSDAISSLLLDSATTSPATAELLESEARNDLYTGTLTIGKNHRGTVIQSAMLSNVISSDLTVASGSASVGVFNATSGYLTVGGNAYIGAGGNGSMIYDGLAASFSNSIYVGYSAGSTGSCSYIRTTYSTFTVGTSEFVGYSGTGTFLQTAGIHAINGTGASGLYLGETATGNGTFNLSGGTLTVASNEDLGATGTGLFIQSGGTNTTLSFYLGVDGPGDFGAGTGNGTYNMTGGNLVENGGSQYSYEMVGYYGRGTFAQHGGTNSVGSTAQQSNLYIGYFDGSVGLYTMDAAAAAPTLNVSGSEVLGTSGNGGFGGCAGTFNQSAGTHTINGNLIVGNGAGSTGLFLLSGGALTVNGYESIGNYGVGRFNQSGGNHSTSQLLIDPNSTGAGDSFLLSGGNLSAGTIVNHAVFTQTGGGLSTAAIDNTGTFTISSAITAQFGSFTNTGVATIGGSQLWSTGSVYNNAGGSTTFSTDAGSESLAPLSLVANAGNVMLSTSFHVSSLMIGPATVAIPVGTPRRVLETASLTFNSPSGTLDLGDNGLIVHNGNLAAITSEISSGYAQGSWAGSGIISSSARADTSHLTAIGVLLNSDAQGQALISSFVGQSTVATDVLAAYTYYGDANLDGKVDSADYTLIDNGYLTHLTGWYNGDFNYDGVINGSDYTLIDNAFNTQGGPLSTSTEFAGNSTESAAVPEPGHLLIGACLAMILRRRVRRPARQKCYDYSNVLRYSFIHSSFGSYRSSRNTPGSSGSSRSI